jgi:hypothetical protein
VACRRRTGAGAGEHMARSRAVRGSWSSGTRPAKAAGSNTEKRSRGTGGRQRRTSLQFIKTAGTPL